MRSDLEKAFRLARPPGDWTSGYYLDLDEDPSVIFVATSSELGELVAEAYDCLGGRLPEKEREAIVRHEGQHAEAAYLLGAKSVSYLLQVIGEPRPDGSGTDAIGFIPSMRPQFDRPPTLFMNAIIAAYPTDPSRGDEAFIRELGFEGVDDVVQRTLKMNHDFDSGYPVPLAARASQIIVANQREKA